MAGSKKIDVDFQSIWDGGLEVISPAVLDLETGKLVHIEDWSEPEGAQELDSNSIILKMGGMTVVYDLVVRGDSYFISEKDLEKTKAFFNNDSELAKFKTQAELQIDALRLQEKLGDDCSDFKFDFDGYEFYNVSFESKIPINNILAVMNTIPDSHVMMRNLIALETAAEEKSNTGESARYNLFIEKCKEVCDAYGITLGQYFKVTCNQNSIDFENGINFNMIHDWAENEKFINMFLSSKNLSENKVLDVNDLSEQIENLAYENKKMAEFLESLGYSQEQITDICVGTEIKVAVLINTEDKIVVVNDGAYTILMQSINWDNYTDDDSGDHWSVESAIYNKIDSSKETEDNDEIENAVGCINLYLKASGQSEIADSENYRDFLDYFDYMAQNDFVKIDSFLSSSSVGTTETIEGIVGKTEKKDLV
ncbi:MAG: hypothetical protein A3F91_09555 [Flavobacteria bacterium RIFCSPLOWO2_12_FULL_35_11]|nr:MAG: hypothetical protein A3F91_09555 [Flavobacteria bacterium RIFCSPLOWO2_12_FULL_35_11]